MHHSTCAGPSGRRCELSLEDRDSFFSIKDGVLCQCRQEKNWGGARATLGAFAGRVYYEVGQGARCTGKGGGLVNPVQYKRLPTCSE